MSGTSGATALMYSMSSSDSVPACDRLAPTTVLTSHGTWHEAPNDSRSRSSKNSPWNSATAIVEEEASMPTDAFVLYRAASTPGVTLPEHCAASQSLGHTDGEVVASASSPPRRARGAGN